MNGEQRVRNAILGKPLDRQPVYGWVKANLEEQITARWGSVAAFEDHYEFDAAHIFGGPRVFNKEVLDKIQEEEGDQCLSAEPRMRREGRCRKRHRQ